MEKATTRNRPLIAATRQELSFDLNVKSGRLPTDWSGHVYVTSPAGTVNSDGLPFPPGNQETGSPVMNGDGYLFRFDLNGSTLHVQTGLLKPICYYADVATRRGNTNGYGDLFHFYNLGLSRLALDLGARNLLNTAITPFRFAQDAAPRLLACYDAGRPWEVNPDTLQVITPIGANSEWTPTTPAWLFPFPIVQSTAHPSFDPETRELFLVNFTKDMEEALLETDALQKLLKEHPETIKDLFEKVIGDLHQFKKPEEALKAMGEQIRQFGEEELEFHALNWLQHVLRQKTAQSTPAEVYLLRWTGASGPMDKWQVIDPEGKPIAIEQCMHQTTLTKDYIVLADATFKFTLDVLFNVPFKSPKLDNWLRQLLTAPQLPYLNVYLVKRSDLVAGQKTVTARPLASPIPLEAIHFSAEYANPDGRITLHLAHNSAACLAEWVRTFDTLAPDGARPADPEAIGLISTGSMDIGRIGRVVIDANQGDIVEQHYITEEGNLADPAHIGVHTWGVGLYTYRDIISPDRNVDTIRHIYWSCYGMDPRLLTKFIYDLYYDYANRMIAQETMLKISEQGIPFVLSRQNTQTMTLDDFYQFDPSVILKSVQFVPRRAATPGLDPQMDGYILTTTLVNYPNAGGNNYQCEVWIFDAANLKQGPVCTLNHPQLDYAFTLHSAWTEQAAPPTATYRINLRDDYNALIGQLEPKERRADIQRLFDDYVYPAMETGKVPNLPAATPLLEQIWNWIKGLFKKKKKK